MENTTMPTAATPVPSQVVTPEVFRAHDLPSEKLLNALYWIWDAFSRAHVPFFLVGQTAKDAMANKELTGDKVTVGTRRMEWVSGGRRILDAFAQPLEEDQNKATYEFEGTLVIVHVYDDHDCIMNTDSINYKYESFKVPNPYKTFEEIYG